MQKLILATLVMVSASLAAGCGEISSRGFTRGADTAANRTSGVERLLPENGELSREQLATLIDAIRAVRPDISQKELPLNGKAVRLVLQDMSVRDLDRVEAILPSIAKKRKAEGASVD